MKVSTSGLSRNPNFPDLGLKKNFSLANSARFSCQPVKHLSLLSALGIILVTLPVTKVCTGLNISNNFIVKSLSQSDSLSKEKQIAREAENETVASLFELYRDAIEPFVNKINNMLKLFQHTEPELTDLFIKEMEELEKTNNKLKQNNVSPESIRKLGIKSPSSEQTKAARQYFESIRIALLQAYYMVDSEMAEGEQNVPEEIIAALEELEINQLKFNEKLNLEREKLKSAIKANNNHFEDIWGLGDLVTEATFKVPGR